MTNFRTQATNRVENSETLSPFQDLLIDYDWDNQDDHNQWVATAPESELVDWAQTIRKGEQEAAEEDATFQVGR